ncbi:copper chaperone [Devosia enhydra]|uniref:Copper chaperone n=1 Tax=Devosia enhydra TaxID=665118 RepID=A0A1K2HVQ1_9HYPH|nr:heavy-metal-associated domain-containing protein [Devosia enhydra]SFZ81916.1 copper chaperone [Devosia enhydra]
MATEQAPARFQVNDMTCGHCVGTVRNALAKALPDAAVDIDLEHHIVSVSGDARIARTAITDAGYTPEPV